MLALFADLPEATDNSVEIALRCAYRPLTRKPILPRFSVPGGEAVDEEQELRRQADEGLERLLARYGCAPGVTQEDYRQRLEFELSVIVRMKFPGYFLIVADFIKWAKAQGIPVGPGRGSGAGSLVAYALTITDLDPIRFGLLFERFLNPERVSMPDFDIDFCQDRRDEVIAYVRQRYGADRVAQIITFGSFLARGVMRNVGRVLEMPLGQVDKLAKLVPQNPAKPVTLKAGGRGRAEACRRRRRADPKVAKMLAIAERLEGLYSNASTHAAGVVIGDRPLVELVPLYRDPKSDMPATQFNMKWVEPAGLVKFDFLGLKTLTTLAHGAEPARAARRRDRPRHDPARRHQDLRDARARRDGRRVPGGKRRDAQGAGRDARRPVRGHHRAGRALSPRPDGEHPDLLRAQARPGGRRTTSIPRSSRCCSETFGVIIYQEQVMQIAQVLSGYSLGEADMLRRAMGKKIKAEMDAQRDRFVNGAVERGVDEGQGRRDLRPARQIRRLRLQQEPRGGLCADRLLDRLVQGQPSRRIPRRVDDARQVQHRQARRIPRRGAAPRRQGRAALGQQLRRRFRRAPGRLRRAVDRLCAQRDQGRRRRPGGGDRRRARRASVRLADRSRGAARPARGQQEGAGKPRRRRRLRRTRARARASPSPRSSRCWRSPTGTPRSGRRARTRCSARRERAAESARRALDRRRKRCGANSTRSASSSPAIRSRPTMPR